MPTLDFTTILDPRDPPVPSGIRTESGLRTRNASELRSLLEPHLADYGITRVAHLTGFDFVGLPVHMAVKPQGRTLSSGSGKGPTTDASWVSAVMECAEQSVWESLRSDAVEASEAMLRRMGVAVVDGRRLPQLKGAIWSDQLPVRWVPGWDIVAGCEVYVPDSLVTVAGQGWDLTLKPFTAGSNGLASGAHILEAVLSGLQEVIERDGVCLRTQIDPAPKIRGDELLRECAPDVAEKITRSGVQLEVLDASTEIGVPTVVAYLHDVEGGRTGVFKGAGAGVGNGTALVRAVTEAAQARCLIVAGARDDLFETMRSSATSRAAIKLSMPEDQLRSGIDHGTGDILGDIRWMVGKLVSAGFDQVIVLRHTAPGDPIQVARVIVPGLEGYQFAFAQTGERAAQWAAAREHRMSA
jgi:ribosomal protein S12 methylthiotransferase accessory factor